MVAAAKGQGPPPHQLTVFWVAQRMGMPLYTGGLLQQPVRAVKPVLYMDRVYRVILDWRAGRRLDAGDSALVMTLTKRGLLSKRGAKKKG